MTIRRHWFELVLLAPLLSGCGSPAASRVPTAVPTPTPAPTATVTLGFVVQVTAVPTTRPTPRPRPRPTPFHPPVSGSYLILGPAAGPPVSRTITVRGGRLPVNSPISLVWTAGRSGAAIGTTVMTNRTGAFYARFTVPAAPPGRYRVLAEVAGVPYASAPYTIISVATLAASVDSSGQSETLDVTGAQFVPHLKLLLVAYPLAAHGKPIVVGQISSDGRGRISYSHPTHLAPGQYALRAWAVSGLSSQMAETYFEVVL